MRTYHDCIPCLVRQALESARQVSTDEQVHERILREVLLALADIDMANSPPAMAQRIHRLLRRMTGKEDPYLTIKEQCNHTALAMLPELRDMVRTADNPLEMAVRLAIAGNIIDIAVYTEIDADHVRGTVQHAVATQLAGDVSAFADATQRAQSILYLADNAGEIVFDRLLIEQLPSHKITVAVKGAPIINDATMADAETAGLHELVTVVDNGSDAPGTILSSCSPEFREFFDQADLVIAKGQGNYETLSGETDKDIFFLLKAKCPVVAGHLDCDVGTLVLSSSEEAGREDPSE